MIAVRSTFVLRHEGGPTATVQDVTPETAEEKAARAEAIRRMHVAANLKRSRRRGAR